MRKKYLVLTTVLCLSMMLFAGCGNNNSTDHNNAGTGATASPGTAGNDMEDGADSAVDDIGEGAKDVIDGAEDAVDGAANGTKKAIDGVTDDSEERDMNDTNSGTDTDTNNSVTSGKN